MTVEATPQVRDASDGMETAFTMSEDFFFVVYPELNGAEWYETCQMFDGIILARSRSNGGGRYLRVPYLRDLKRSPARIEDDLEDKPVVLPSDFEAAVATMSVECGCGRQVFDTLICRRLPAAVSLKLD